MSTTTAHVQISTPPYDPLATLADAIGSVLTDTVGNNSATSGALAFQVSKALHHVLEATTPQSRITRMLLIRHLVDIESQIAGIEIPQKNEKMERVKDQISTAQAAEILGYSRPYVAMLIDQNKLTGATVSSGGHRRVSRAAVLAWKETHQTSDKATDLRKEGQKIGAYKSTEAEVIRRIKALASSRG